MLKNINRRKFVAKTATAADGILLGENLKTCSHFIKEGMETPSTKYDIMKEVMKYRKIDAHAHVYFSDDSPEIQLDFGKRLGIDKQVVSRFLDRPGGPEETLKIYAFLEALMKVKEG